MEKEIQLIDKFLQFGFAAVMAIFLLWVIWKIVTFNTKATRDMYSEHKADLAKKDEDHREERKETIDTFEKTILRITNK